MKKRHRQMAGKAMKDVTALNRCSACGHVKRAHLLCPYCVKGRVLCIWITGIITHSRTEIQDMFRGKVDGKYQEKTRSDKPEDE